MQIKFLMKNQNQVQLASIFFLITLIFSCSNLFAQLKVLSGGKIGIGTSVVNGTKVQIQSDMENMCLKLITNNAESYGYVSQFESAGPHMKAIAISLNGADNGYWLSNGEVWGTGLFTFSDQRLKTKIIDIDNPMDKIMKLRGVFYYYKPNASLKGFGLNLSDTSRQIGFIAQEVRAVIPEVVDSSAKGALGINYNQLIALLTAGIQQQQGELNALKIQLNQCCEKNTPIGKKDTLINLGKTSSTSLLNQQFVLYQNQPNPFSVNTLINYQTPTDAKGINLMVFNMQGELIKSYTNLLPGKQNVQINGSDLKPGMYLYSLISNGNEIDTKRMILSE